MKPHDPINNCAPLDPSSPRRASHTMGMALAMGCFAGAFLMMGGACFLVLDWPATLNEQKSAVAVGTLGAALAFAGLGVFSLMRENHGPNRPSRAFPKPKAVVPPPDPVAGCLNALKLTDKERAIARLVLEHRSYNDIAVSCNITPRTVQFHASNLFHKAGVSRRRDFERLVLERVAAASTFAPPHAHAAAKTAPDGMCVSESSPCAFPECAVCRHRHVSPSQPKGNDW